MGEEAPGLGGFTPANKTWTCSNCGEALTDVFDTNMQWSLPLSSQSPLHWQDICQFRREDAGFPLLW